MMRQGACRSVLRPLSTTPSTAYNNQLVSQLCARSASRQFSAFRNGPRAGALSTYRKPTAVVRTYATQKFQAVYGTSRDPEREKRVANSLLSTPQDVSMSSTVQPVFAPSDPAREEEAETDMMAGIRHDWDVIKHTFAFQEVPREAYNIGLAGVIPYLATSAATVACAFEVSAAAETGHGYFLSQRSAELCLHILEPLQVGYGAVILSFLGAIHWGLEWAGYGGKIGYRRYAIGVLAPAVAWPTTLLPVEYALITQFIAFNILYSVDSSATIKGWTPPWYSTYRFVLTFFVGASIVISLIGRGHIADHVGELPTAGSRVRELRREYIPDAPVPQEGEDGGEEEE